MKKIWMALLTAACVVFGALGLVACADEDEHSFSSDWSHDDNRHWHACTVHTDCYQREGTAAHDFDANGECKVCHYTKHLHSFVWQYDEENHRQQATCEGHEDVVENEGPHSFDANGNCVCGVTEAQTQVYPVYKAHQETAAGSAQSFSDWVAALNTNGDVVSLTAAGDGQLAHEGGAPETKWYAKRTVTVEAKSEGAPLANVWFKAVADEDSKALAVAKTDATTGVATLSFVPVEGFKDYIIKIADKADGITGSPYPGNQKPNGTTQFTVAISENMGGVTSPIGTVSFDRVLGVGTSFGMQHVTLDTGSWGEHCSEIPLVDGIEAGYYKLHVTNFSRDNGENPLLTAGFMIAKMDTETFECYYDSDNRACDIILYIPADATSIATGITNTGATTFGDITLTKCASTVTVGDTIYAAVHANSAKSYGIDVSGLARGLYVLEGETLGNRAGSGSTGNFSHFSYRLGETSGRSGSSWTLAQGSVNNSARAIVILREGDSYLTFYDSTSTKSHYFSFTLTPIEQSSAVNTVTVGTAFTHTFKDASGSELGAIYKAEIPSDGDYIFYVSGDSSFATGSLDLLTASSTTHFPGDTRTGVSTRGSSVIVPMTAGTAYFWIRSDSVQSGAGTGTFKIEKVASATIEKDTATEVELTAAENSVNYSFTAAEEGFYTFSVWADSAIAGSSVSVDGVTVATAGAGEKIVTAIFWSGAASTKFNITFSGNGNAISAKAYLTKQTPQEISSDGTSKTFSSSDRIGYFTLGAGGSSARDLGVVLTGDVSDYILYKVTRTAYGTTNIVTKQGAASVVFESVSAAGDLLIVVYTGSSESAQFNIKEIVPLPSFTISQTDGSITWNKVNGATDYEIWLDVDRAGSPSKVHEIHAADEDKFSYDIPKQYYGAGIYEWKVVAKAEGKGSSEAKTTETNTRQKALVTVNVTIPAGYPAGSLTVGIYVKSSTAIVPYATKQISIVGNEGMSTTLRFFGDEDTWDQMTFGATSSLNSKYSETTQTIKFTDHEMTIEYAPVKKTETTVTVTVKLPAAEASMTTLDSLSVRLTQDGSPVSEAGKSTEWAAQAIEAAIQDSGELTWELTINKAGNYAIEASSVTQGFTVEKKEFNITEENLGEPVSVQLEVKPVENTVNINLPEGYNSGALTVEVYSQGGDELVRTVSVNSVSGQSATAQIAGLAAGEYKVTVYCTARPYRYRAENVTLTVSESFEGSATAEVEEGQGVEVTVNVYGFGAAATVSVKVYKADDEAVVIDTATIEIAEYAKTALLTIFVPEDGSYTVKSDAYTSSSKNSLAGYGAGTCTVNIASGETEDTFTLPIAEPNVKINVTVANDGLNGKELSFHFKSGSGSGFDFKVTIEDAKATIYLFNLDTMWGNNVVSINKSEDTAEYDISAQASIGNAASGTFTIAITEKGGVEMKDVSVYVHTDGFINSYEGTLTLSIFDSAQGGIEVGESYAYDTMSGGSQITMKFPKSYVDEGKVADLQIKLVSAKGIGGFYDFTDKVKVNDNAISDPASAKGYTTITWYAFNGNCAADIYLKVVEE